MKLDIRLNVWNKNDQMLHWAQGVEVDGVQGTELAGNADNQQYWTTMHQAIVGQGVQKGYLKFPYWVNIDDFKGPNNDYGGLIKYGLVEVVDAGQKIITIKGFRLAKPISIDSSKFFDFSAQLLTSPLYLDPTQRLDEFVRWLNQPEDKILDYIVTQDQAVNQGARTHSKEEWKRRLQFNYSINNTTHEAFTFTSNNAADAINQELARQTGKLWFMYSDSFVNGFKLWVKINDLEPDSPYTLEDHSTDNQKGFELKGFLDTQNVILQLNMNEWIY